MFKIEKAVITGAAGFIGKALVKYLIKNGTEVIAVDRNYVAIPGSEFRQIDLTKRNAIEDCLCERTVLFHLAANASVAGSVSDPRKDFQDNIYSLLEVFESARKKGCQIIFPSTASIYDTSNTLPLNEKAYIKPTSPYAAAKIAGEAYCAAYHRSFGLNIKIARMFSVYGNGMNRFAIHDLIRKIQNNEEQIELLGDGNQIRDYLFIDDVVRGLVVIASNGEPGEDYNLASGEAVKLIDLAHHISRIMGKNSINIIPTGKSFPGDIPKWYADITKIRSIGFEPKITLEDGLNMTVNWLTSRENDI
jgi:UDP-glucose 4-epimerase